MKGDNNMDLQEMLGKELFEQVQAKIGDKKLMINDGSYIPIAKFNEKNEELKTLKSEITNRDTQLKELAEKAKGNDDLTSKINELTSLNEQTKNEYETKIKDITLNSAIEKALSTNNAKYVDLLLNKVDKSKLVLDNDKIVGLDEQIKTLQENYKDMFTTKVVGNTPNTGGSLNNDSSENSLMDSLRKAAGLS